MKHVSGSLNDTLKAVADYLNIDAVQLQSYANEDPYTGWDFGAGDWPVGSLHRPEGQTLYALIRYFKATALAEVGALYGCSTTHMAQALADNGNGKITSIDIDAGARKMLPPALAKYVIPVTEWGEVAIGNLKDNSLWLMYEDGDHNIAPTRGIWEAALSKVIPGGLLISHDPCHGGMKHGIGMGWCVIQGVTEALGHDDFLVVQVPPSDCGLLIYRKPV